MDPIETKYGKVTLETLIGHYEKYREQEAKKYEKRKEFFQTEAGRQYQRKRAKMYYEKNKELVNMKNKARYLAKKALSQEDLRD